MPSQVYFESNGVGAMYYATQDTQLGESPATAPDKWARIAIPARARSYLRLAAAAIVRRTNGEQEAAMALHALATRQLQETTRLAARERIPYRMPVQVAP
jgi:hypothetical protein